VWCAGGKVLQELGGCAPKARSYACGNEGRVHRTDSALQCNLKETHFRSFSQNAPLPYPDSLVVRAPQKNVLKIQAQCLCLARREADVVERWSDDKIAKRSR
jgi:hypothetical protein